MGGNNMGHLAFEDVFRVFDILMATLGINKIYQSGNILTQFRFFQGILCVISTSNLSLLLVAMLFFMATAESILDILETLPNTLVSIIALVKLGNLIVRRELIYELMSDLKILWPRDDDKLAINRFNKAVSPTLKIFYLYLAMNAATAFTFGIIPIFRASMDYVQFGKAVIKVPYKALYPFDYEYSVSLHMIVFVTQFWAGFIVGNLMVTFDMFMCMLISLLCYHFETISDALKAIQPKTSDNNYDYGIIKQADNCLKSCVLYHCHLLRLCQLLEEIFSFTMFVNLSISSITICGLLFNILVMPPDKLFIYVFYIASATAQVFLLCWYSDKLIRQSSKLTSAAYHCGWYTTNKHFRMSLIQLQIRTQKPVILTAMKFIILSINTFLHIVGSAWSYFTLLRRLYGK